ncbi:MAG: dTMP kinase [Firmicutes bacterium]|nr:dTMP kinase [Bacillota bacterium]
MDKGIFITFEGGDGAGKSTQIGLLNDELISRGYDVLLLREPGGTAISEKIREIILDKDNSEMTYKTEAFLYAAARAQLVEEVIEPAINKGSIVICDRFVDSSMAYQSYGRELGDMVWDINRYAISGIMPELTFFLKVDPEKGRKRISGRDLDRMELASAEFHNRVFDGYLELEKLHPDRIVGIKADQPIETIATIIIDKVIDKLDNR